MRYGDTLALLSRLPALKPAASLPSRLDELFEKLHACTHAAGATPIEDEIWNCWMYDTHEGAELQLQRASDDIAGQRYDLAETRLAILLRRRPDYAEAWNKRATLCYLMERDDDSVAAIHHTLEIEPRHFGALCGLGEILLSQGEREAALLAFERALRVHPHLANVRATLQDLLH